MGYSSHSQLVLTGRGAEEQLLSSHAQGHPARAASKSWRRSEDHDEFVSDPQSRLDQLLDPLAPGICHQDDVALALGFRLRIVDALQQCILEGFVLSGRAALPCLLSRLRQQLRRDDEQAVLPVQSIIRALRELQAALLHRTHRHHLDSLAPLLLDLLQHLLALDLDLFHLGLHVTQARACIHLEFENHQLQKSQHRVPACHQSFDWD